MVIERQQERNASQMLNSFLYLQKDSEQDNGHSLDLGAEKKCYLISEDGPQGEWDKNAELMMLTFGESTHPLFRSSEDSPQGEWDKMAEKMMVTLAESGHPVFRATSPLSRGVLKSKGGGKLSIHYCADQESITTVFRTITSVNQLSIYGTVSDLCDEYRICQARTERPVIAQFLRCSRRNV